MNRDVVEGATRPVAQATLISEKDAVWQAYSRSLAGKGATERMMGAKGVLRRDKPFPGRFKSDDETVITRLGAQGPRLTHPPDTIGPFGALVTTISLPSDWVHGPVPDGPLTLFSVEDEFGFVFGEQMFRYSRVGVDRLTGNSA